MKTRKSFLLRIDPALFDALDAWAQQELRSLNGQIEYILKDAVARRRSHGQEPGVRSQEPGVRSQESGITDQAATHEAVEPDVGS
jgi:hypothetical protein